MSRGEQAIWNYLESQNIELIREKTFSDLKGFNGGYLRYDFNIVLDSDVQGIIILELDGKQHYKPTRFSSDQTKRYDRIKNEYNNLHDYPLLRIKYNQIEKVNELVSGSLAEHTL